MFVMKAIRLLVMITPLVLLIGCAAKPISVAKKYFKAMEAKDYDLAKTYLTSESVETFELLYVDDPASHTYKVLRVEEGEDGTTARVYYLQDDQTNEQYIDMVKQNDVWLISLSSDK